MSDVLQRFDPLIRRWFQERFAAPTEPQREGWPRIADRQHTLIAAPTGSGKTLAAFLVCIDRLVRQWREQRLEDGVQVVYVSPLKALSNDIERNLNAPLTEISALAVEQEGQAAPDSRGGADRRHTRLAAAADAAAAAASAGDHAGVVVPAAHFGAEPGDSARREDGDRGRDPRPGARQARVAPGAVAGAARAAVPAGAPAYRTLGHSAAHRPDRGLPGRRQRRLPRGGRRARARPGPGGRASRQPAVGRLQSRAMDRGLRQADRTDPVPIAARWCL